LTSFIGGVRSPELALMDRQALMELTLEDLRRLLGVTGAPVFEHIAVYREAIPQYEVGYGRYKQILTDMEERSPGLFFAGQYRDGISVADCIVSGQKAATRIAAARVESGVACV
jgi:oxygen-dependent protoporphyrinogen oxidase